MAYNRLTTSGGYGSSEEEISCYNKAEINSSKDVVDNSTPSPVDPIDKLIEMEQYGSTPPRTRILRKTRERRQREKESNGVVIKVTAPHKKALSRRNTISSVLDDLIAKADSSATETPGKRTSKRSMKLLRGSERDLKLDITSAQMVPPNDCDVPKTPCIQVESRKRFMCLFSRPVTCIRSINALTKSESTNGTDSDIEILDCPQRRVDFYKTFSLLIRMGCGDKNVQDRNPRRHMSREDYLWQNELKDLIWLELQAWHADRTLTEQDNYLCEARESIAHLLHDIMTYRFKRTTKNLSARSSDSGVEGDDCGGCVSMLCHSCIEAQNEALREVEKMLRRLETAESLFQSSKAFADSYPIYNSSEFVGRVKAMCLWYNMTNHQLLKLIIIGRLLTCENKYYSWPQNTCDDGNSIDNSSPSDSNSSSSSNEYLSYKTPMDVCNITSIIALVYRDSCGRPSPYRKYIENILKTRGLSKSLNFLDRLHHHVLRKAQVTLEKPYNDDVFNKVPSDLDEEELRRFGAWSPEAQALGLPSYKAAFLFLATVPLEIIHEFLCMRLEQKPENPSPLSVRQLLRELKEGLRISVAHRQRILEYVKTALVDHEEASDPYKKKLDEFNVSLLKIFELYLEYVEQWALLQHDTFQKSLVEDEWNFSSEIAQHIEGGSAVVGKKFCHILSVMYISIGERLLGRIDELIATVQAKQDDLNKKQSLFTLCRELQSLFNEERERSIKTVSFAKHIFKSDIATDHMLDLKEAVVSLKCTIPNAIEKIQEVCDVRKIGLLDETEKLSLTSRCREALQQGYRFGFEFFKEMSEFIPTQTREKLARSMVHFAHLWMKFVQERFERGRGVRPRWAYQGLDFLLTVCEPRHTVYLSNEEFEELNKHMDACISHVIGNTAPSTPDSGFHSASPRMSLEHIRAFPRSRGSSPSPRSTYRSQRSATNRKTSSEKSPFPDQLDSPTILNISRKEEADQETLIKLQPVLHSERVRDAVEQLDLVIDERLREQDLIGRVITITKDPVTKAHLRRRYVTFTWQRGIKIGQGRFGKVYTAVNNNTGEMMAVKEIALQHNDVHTIRKVAEELKILEGVVQRNLVKYHGLEVHKEEMLLFMEFCAEGTLENLVAGTENGLPELLVRRFTYQLLCGVAELHTHGIVHRDIKCANIFLTDGGNCLKIGDFGCAVKIKAHTTIAGELQGFVGTQAYMAPEVFMKSSGEGHGRAADIWSVGCVVIEMASGKRPWAEFDTNYQIMFKVGMGQKPEAPDSLIEEGHDFVDLCLRHNPRDRPAAVELLDHNFVKIGDDLM